MSRGRIAGQFGRGEFDAYRIGSLMTGAEPEPELHPA
jgi:hypothetical protein